MLLTTISEADTNRLIKWLSGELQETIVLTEEFGRVILFHSSNHVERNAELLTNSRFVNKEGSLLTCYSKYHSKEIQSRCILLTEEKVTISYLGGYLFSVN